MEWEERWRREKETRKRIIERGGVEVEEDSRELRRIVAFNDSRMGLKSGVPESEGSVLKTTNADEGGTSVHDRFGGEERNVHTCRSKTFPAEFSAALKEFRDSNHLTDLTLTAEDGSSFHVHSVILAAISAFILERVREKRFISDGQGAGAHRWAVHLGAEVDFAGLQAVIEFAYTGAVSSLQNHTAAKIMAAAQILEVPRLVDLCNKEHRLKEGKSLEQEQMKTSSQEQMSITLQSVEQLWVDKVGCDVILEVDGSFINVHRVIMAASNDFFRGMFTCGMRESQQNRVALPFLPAPEMETLVGFSYRGKLQLSWDNVFEITCMALQLQFRSALMLCLTFMQEEMQASSCLDVASFAEAYGMPELLEEANDFNLLCFEL
ncbi:unnamed protein product [Menidia menidia]|uniref:(Atlantic silverside) hypothetical protein n=1 Tax=Menidia menidia TaxID=238744 RepID=A0A8S4B5D3_9TELE|nr:unnamed protein product [Menidia menidia]